MKNVIVYEKVFLGTGAALLIACFCTLFYASVSMGIVLPTDEGQLDPTKVSSTPPFDKPGLRQIGPKKFEVVVLARTFFFIPNQIEVPEGAEVTFIATSGDVIHGFHIERTRLNLMLIPGQVTKDVYTFKKAGEYRVLCHEYCGAGHHAMSAKIIVTGEGEGEEA